MEKTKTISAFQLFSIMFISSVFSAMMYSKYTVHKLNLLMYSVALVISAVLLLILTIPLVLFQKRSNGNNIIKAVQIRKPLLSGFFTTVYSIYFMYASVVSLVIFSFLLTNFVNPKLPFLEFFVIALVCCYYGAYKGITALSRGSVIFFAIVAVAQIFIRFSLAFRINPLNYSYIFVENGGDIYENLIFIISQMSAVPAIFLFTHKIKGGIKKPLYLWIAISNAVVLFISVMSFGLLGEYMQLTPYPLYTATQLMEIGSFKRLEVIFLILWTIGLFVNVSLSMYALRETVQSSFRAEKVRILNPLSAVLIGAVALGAVNSETLRRYILDTRIMLVMFLLTAVALPITAVLAVGHRKLSPARAKTAVVSVIALLIIPLLTGCRSTTQIQDRLIIKGVGIDKDKDEYVLTVQYVDNYSDGDSQRNECVQVRGKSVGEAMGHIKNSSGREPFLGQNVAMVVGWETACGDMESVLDYFVRYIDTRPTVKLYVSETTAEDILTLEVAGEIIPIDRMSDLSPSDESKNNLFTILYFMNQSKSFTDTPTVSALHADENTIKLSTVAVLGEERGTYLLDENQYITYKTLIGMDNGTVLNFESVSGRVTDCKTKINSESANGILNFDVDCKLALTILENPEEYSDSEIESLFVRELSEIMTESLKETLNEKHCDIYNLGRHLKFEDARTYSDKDFYNAHLGNCRVNMNVECKIVDTTR